MVNNIYIVKENDTLDGIANKFNVPVSIIKQINGYKIIILST